MECRHLFIARDSGTVARDGPRGCGRRSACDQQLVIDVLVNGNAALAASISELIVGLESVPVQSDSHLADLIRNWHLHRDRLMLSSSFGGRHSSYLAYRRLLKRGEPRWPDKPPELMVERSAG